MSFVGRLEKNIVKLEKNIEQVEDNEKFSMLYDSIVDKAREN